MEIESLPKHSGTNHGAKNSEKQELKEKLEAIARLRGASKRKTTPEEFEIMPEKGFEDAPKKLEEERLKEAIVMLTALKGKAPRKTTDEERKAVREKVAKEIEEKFRQGHRLV